MHRHWQAKFKFTIQSLIRAFQLSQQLSSTASPQVKVGYPHGDLLDREGGRGTVAERRKGKRGGSSSRNETSMLPTDADPTAKGSTPSDVPAAGADDDTQVVGGGRGEVGRPARPRRAGNGRRPNSTKRERGRGGVKPDESSGAGSQAEADGQAKTEASSTGTAPEASSSETPAA
jgi:hypothetical protein